MTVTRMDNVGIVVEDINAALEFFTELGLELEGRAPIEGDWADGVTGLRDMRVEIAMMRTPDGHSRLEMSRFLAPPVVADHRSAPVNALGYLRVMEGMTRGRRFRVGRVERKSALTRPTRNPVPLTAAFPTNASPRGGRPVIGSAGVPPSAAHPQHGPPRSIPLN